MPSESAARRIAAKALRTAVGSGVYALLPFIGAGRLDLFRAWVFGLLFVGVSVAGSAIVEAANPGLLAERAKGVRADTRDFDKLFYVVFLPLAVAYPLLAGLDVGRLGTPPLPVWTMPVGALLFVAGSALSTWTMVVNAFAESTVRIQGDRGHAVVGAGPYRIVRHPMYLGTIVGVPGVALMLGSALSLAPMAGIVALFVWRTAREDRALRQDLAGYEDYARRTRFRLVPGVW